MNQLNQIDRVEVAWSNTNKRQVGATNDGYQIIIQDVTDDADSCSDYYKMHVTFKDKSISTPMINTGVFSLQEEGKKHIVFHRATGFVGRPS